jgi:hypothetical protein
VETEKTTAELLAENRRLKEKIEQLGQINSDLYMKYMKASNDLKWYQENTKERLLKDVA